MATAVRSVTLKEKFKVRKSYIVRIRCPFCGEEKRLKFSKRKNQFKCKVCGNVEEETKDFRSSREVNYE